MYCFDELFKAGPLGANTAIPPDLYVWCLRHHAEGMGVLWDTYHVPCLSTREVCCFLEMLQKNLVVSLNVISIITIEVWLGNTQVSTVGWCRYLVTYFGGELNHLHWFYWDNFHCYKLCVWESVFENKTDFTLNLDFISSAAYEDDFWRLSAKI